MLYRFVITDKGTKLLFWFSNFRIYFFSGFKDLIMTYSCLVLIKKFFGSIREEFFEIQANIRLSLTLISNKPDRLQLSK